MSKKLILITAVLGLVSFAGAFTFKWFTKPIPEDQIEESELSTSATLEVANDNLLQLQTNTTTGNDSEPKTMTRYMSEQQLKNLVNDLQNKMREYENKLQRLKVQEQRLALVQDMLKKDIEKLNNLQIELASTTANIKSERDKLLNSRLEIERTETNNLASIAATYDKMDSSSASMIFANMCTASESSTEQNGQANKYDDSFNDAVKILYYMTDRTKAKLLAELATTKPDLAADISGRLKQIVEVQ
jgi:hypothetical protein